MRLQAQFNDKILQAFGVQFPNQIENDLNKFEYVHDISK